MTAPEPACERAFDDWLASTILPAEAVNSSAVGDVAREAFCSGWDAFCDGEMHELVFTDREARPAKWQTRCGRTDVPLENAISLPAGYYPVTCKGCIRIAELEQQLEHAKSALAGDHEGIRVWMLDCAAVSQRRGERIAGLEAALKRFEHLEEAAVAAAVKRRVAETAAKDRDAIIAALAAKFGPHRSYGPATRTYEPDGNDAEGSCSAVYLADDGENSVRVLTYGEIADALTGFAPGSREGRIAELERIADEMLAKLSEGVCRCGMEHKPVWVSASEYARWKAIRNAGEAALAAADEVSRLGEELQGGDPL